MAAATRRNPAKISIKSTTTLCHLYIGFLVNDVVELVVEEVVLVMVVVEEVVLVMVVVEEVVLVMVVLVVVVAVVVVNVAVVWVVVCSAQSIPLYPNSQVHLYMFTPSVHAPWFEQVWPAQSSMSVSQLVPVYPTWHLQPQLPTSPVGTPLF